MAYSDLEKKRAYDREWYRRNKAKRMALNHSWRAKRFGAFQKFKADLFCKRCGEDDPVCLDFHHLDPNKKDIAVSTAAGRWSEKRLGVEIEKCVVLCSNCHRKEHAKDRHK